jgi:hypothetical protein
LQRWCSDGDRFRCSGPVRMHQAPIRKSARTARNGPMPSVSLCNRPRSPGSIPGGPTLVSTGFIGLIFARLPVPWLRPQFLRSPGRAGDGSRLERLFNDSSEEASAEVRVTLCHPGVGMGEERLAGTCSTYRDYRGAEGVPQPVESDRPRDGPRIERVPAAARARVRDILGAGGARPLRRAR